LCNRSRPGASRCQAPTSPPQWNDRKRTRGPLIAGCLSYRRCPLHRRPSSILADRVANLLTYYSMEVPSNSLPELDRRDLTIRRCEEYLQNLMWSLTYATQPSPRLAGEGLVGVKRARAMPDRSSSKTSVASTASTPLKAFVDVMERLSFRQNRFKGHGRHRIAFLPRE
jgi:hypothetical protein